MTVSSPVRHRLGRVLNSARHRRDQRLDSDLLRAQLSNYRTTSELSELSAIAGRNDDADTAEFRTLLSRQLSR